MAKRASARSASSGLFDAPALVPVRMPVERVHPAEYQQAVTLITDSLQADIARCESYLARSLSSWEEHEEQIADVNASLVLAFRACAQFFPPDLRPLVNQFLDLRARVLLRKGGE